MKTRLLNPLTGSRLLMFTAFFAAVLISSASFADDVTGDSNNDGSFIPDNNAGVLSTVTITESEIIESARFTIEGLQHTWIGDLIVTVTHLNTGSTATLFNRVGTTSSPTSAGDNSDINGAYTFADNSPSIWTEAANGDTDFLVQGGTYEASGVLEAFVSLDSIFGGESTFGDWQFTISDNNATQFGSFLQTSVEFETAAAVPEPGTMATVVLGTLFGGVYFRRRHQKKNPKQPEEETVA